MGSEAPVSSAACPIVTGTGAVILGSVDQGAHSLVIAGGGNGVNADLFFGPWTGTGVRLVAPATFGARPNLSPEVVAALTEIEPLLFPPAAFAVIAERPAEPNDLDLSS